jgi:hypothetical protein
MLHDFLHAPLTSFRSYSKKLLKNELLVLPSSIPSFWQIAVVAQ